MAKNNSSKNPQIWLLLLMIVLGFLSCGALYVRSVIQPIVVPPAEKLPSPNAYDYYLAAGKMINRHDALKITYAVRLDKPIKASYTAAHPEYKVYSLAEKEALLSKNAGALRKLRDGFRYEYVQPAERFIGMVDYPSSDKLVRLLALEAQVHSANGDLKGAVESYLDAIKLAGDLPRGGGLTSRACSQYATNTSIYRFQESSLIDRLDAATAKAAAKRMEAIAKNRVPFYVSVEVEKTNTIAIVTNMVKKPTLSYKLITMPSLRRYSSFLDRVITREKFRYALRPPASPKPKLTTAIDLLSDIGMADGMPERPSYNCAKSNTMESLLIVSLALRAYKLEHRVYPRNLQDLVPAYIKSVPQDEFAKSGTLSYRVNGSNYILYSVGPDGKDDGGRAVCNPGQNVNNRYYVGIESKGDIVAGINR